MNSSISDSERRFVRVALTAFAAAFVTLLLPYEIVVRASEHRYGIRRANICMPRSLTPKLDSFLTDVANGIRYETYIVGTSRVEASLRPDVLDASLGRSYNAGFGGVSSIATMELFEHLGLHPAHLIVGVSPMDFTPLGIRRGLPGIVRGPTVETGRDRSERAGCVEPPVRAHLHPRVVSRAPSQPRAVGGAAARSRKCPR